MCQRATSLPVRAPSSPPCPSSSSPTPSLSVFLHLSLSVCIPPVQGRERSVLPAAQVVRLRVHHTSRKRELLVLAWKGSDHMRRRSPCGEQETGEGRGSDEATKWTKHRITSRSFQLVHSTSTCGVLKFFFFIISSQELIWMLLRSPCNGAKTG